MRQFSAFAIVLLLGACSDSSGPRNANVSGSWAYTATNLSASGASCNVSNVTLTLTQSGTTFGGSYTGGTLSCGALGGGSFAGGNVVSGNVSGNSITFNLGTQDWSNSGSLSGTTISGTTVVRVVLAGGQTVILNGNFAALKITE